MKKTAICIPIVSNTIQELKQDIKSIQALPYDCIEWRIDCVQEDESIIDMAKMIRSSFMCPILATIRTFAHKGYWNRDKEAYFDLYTKLVDMHVVDWVDLESDLANLPQVTWFHKHGIRVIFSYHTFEAGIGRDAIFQLYNQCLACGADVLKIASMPATIQAYLRPLYDALFDMLGSENFNKYLERGNIEVAPLAYMRGRTLDDSFIILDEAQNTTPEQMKMILTRMGFNSKVVVTGDITQIDLPEGKRSGLVEVTKILKNIDEIDIVRFTGKDVVRHKLVQDIIKAYEKYE